MMSRLQAWSGIGGLFLIALGAVSYAFFSTPYAAILLLPVGLLICGGAGFLAADKPRSFSTGVGATLVVLGLAAVSVLSVFTSEAFLGGTGSGVGRSFRMPTWSTLLLFHFLWMIAAALPTIGLRLSSIRTWEDDVLTWLVLFSTYVAIGLLSVLMGMTQASASRRAPDVATLGEVSVSAVDFR